MYILYSEDRSNHVHFLQTKISLVHSIGSPQYEKVGGGKNKKIDAKTAIYSQDFGKTTTYLVSIKDWCCFYLAILEKTQSSLLVYDVGILAFFASCYSQKIADLS